MSLETDVQGLTDATTDLLVAVNVSKATLDGKVANASSFATASLNSANASAASAATATTQATAAGTARTGAETARDAAVVAQNNAVAVVTGGTATLTPSATKIPLSDAQGKIAKGWLTNTDLVEQTDIGTGPNEIPLNQFLGELAYLDAQNIPTLGINVANATTANVTNLMQVTEISNAVPSLNLDFAKVKQLDPRITFTRASTGTYYDGKTVAKAEENLQIQSQDFDNASWTKGNVTVVGNSAIAPDGTSTADTLDEGTATNYHNVTGRTAQVGTNTISVFAKNISAQYVILTLTNGSGTYCSAVYDTVAGTVANSAAAGSGYSISATSITSVGNGWYRCVMTCVMPSTGEFNIGLSSSTTIGNFGLSSYTGTSRQMYIWGAQLEQRAQATAYTPTTTQAVTTYIPVLLTAASGVPRFEHNPVTGESLGLEIEEQRTNLQTYSQDFSNATAWPNTGQLSSVETNLSVAPDGTITADKVIPNSGVTGYGVFSNIFTWTASVHTASVYLKAAGQTFAQILFSSSISSAFVNFDLSAGVLGTVSAGASGSIVSVGNGWYRCSVTITANAAGGGWLVAPCASSTSARGAGVTGNGFSGIYIWGAQLEAGAFPTSYIPTVASQVTRAADNAVITGANFSSWYRQSEGTFFGDANSLATAGSGGFAGGLFNVAGSGSDRISVFVGASNSPRAESVVSGAVPFGLNNGVALPGVYYKNALSYRVNDFAFVTNGAVNPDNDGVVMPGALSLLIGGAFGPGSLNGTIKKLTYYPRRLSNAELVEMTA